MDPTVPALFSDLNAREGLENVKKWPISLGSNAFVIDRDQKLTGVIGIMELVRAEYDQPLKQLMKAPSNKVNAVTLISHVLDKHTVDDSDSLLPVVDSDSHYLGALDINEVRGLLDKKDKSSDNEAIIAGSALGELFRVGLTGLMQTVAETQLKPTKNSN
jgi:Mg/Co/Ni transporter MgtE